MKFMSASEHSEREKMMNPIIESYVNAFQRNDKAKMCATEKYARENLGMNRDELVKAAIKFMEGKR